MSSETPGLSESVPVSVAVATEPTESGDSDVGSEAITAKVLSLDSIGEMNLNENAVLKEDETLMEVEVENDIVIGSSNTSKTICGANDSLANSTDSKDEVVHIGIESTSSSISTNNLPVQTQKLSNLLANQTVTVPVLPIITITIDDGTSENFADSDAKSLEAEPLDSSDTVDSANQLAERKSRRKRVCAPSPVGTIYRTRTVVKADLAAQIERNEKAQESKAQPLSALSPNQALKPKTMKDILASIPGFGAGRPRKRHSRKLSAAEQLEQTKKEGCIDLETPGSVLAHFKTLKEILNQYTFTLLPPLYQYKLLQLLPDVDSVTSPDHVSKPSSTAFINEFFAKALEEWKKKLQAGEFTPEQRQKKRQEAEREKLKLDPWKIKHFEPIWGEKFVVPSNSAPTYPKPAPTSTVTSYQNANTVQLPATSPNLPTSPLLTRGQVSPIPPSEKTKPLLLDEALAGCSSVKSAIKPSETKVALQNEIEEDSEADNEEVDSDQIEYISSIEDDEETRPNSADGVPASDINLSTALSEMPQALETCSPGKRSGLHLDVVEKPAVLVKKIKIIPPMPPCGEQVPYNMEVKIDEILPATPVATPSTDQDMEDGDDSNFSETMAHPENSPVPSPQEYVTISDSTEIEISSSPSGEFEGDCGVRTLSDGSENNKQQAPESQSELPTQIYCTDDDEKMDDDIIIEHVIGDFSIECTPSYSNEPEPEPCLPSNSLVESCRSVSRTSLRSSDSLMDIQGSESPELQLQSPILANLEETIPVMESVQVLLPAPPEVQETNQTAKTSKECSTPSPVKQTPPDRLPALTTRPEPKLQEASISDIVDKKVDPAELKLAEEYKVEPVEPAVQIVSPPVVEVEDEKAEVKILGSAIPPLLQVVKVEVPAKAVVFETEVRRSPVGMDSKQTIIKIVTVPATTTVTGITKNNPLVARNNSATKTNSLPVKVVSLNTSNVAITNRQGQVSTAKLGPNSAIITAKTGPTNAPVLIKPGTLINTSAKSKTGTNIRTPSSQASTHPTIIPVVLKVSNPNASTSTVVSASQLVSEIKSTASPRPIVSVVLNDATQSKTQENIPTMSIANVVSNQQNMPSENVTTVVVNSLQSTPIPASTENPTTQAQKSFIVQQQVKPNPLHSLPQTVNTSMNSVCQTPGNISNNINSTSKRNRPKPKQVCEVNKMQNKTTAPPGSINLERSYQICQAVIQSSPNREHLQNQLVKPKPKAPPALVNKIQQQQGNTFDPASQIIQIQRRASTPTILQTGQIQSTMPVLSGIQNQKMIVTHIAGPPGAPGSLTIQQQPHSTHTLNPQQNPGMVPLLRPVQPSSPLVHSGNMRPNLQAQQLVVSSETSGSNPTHFSGQGHSGIRMNVALGQNSRINSTVKIQTANNTQPQSMVTGSTTSSASAIITSQQLAMLIQQQQQFQHKQQALSAQQLQQRCQPVPITYSQTRGSPTNVTLSNASIKNTNCNSVFICSPRPDGSIPNTLNSVPHQIKLVNPQFHQTSNSNPSSPRPPLAIPTIQHQIVHIPIQRQQGNNSHNTMATTSNGSPMSFPLRAQIVTSNGETLTIHRASNTLNDAYAVRSPQRVNIGLVHTKQSGTGQQNYFISTEPAHSSSPVPNFGNPNSPALSQNQSMAGNHSQPAPANNQALSNPKIPSPGPGIARSPLRIICRSPQDAGLQSYINNAISSNNSTTNSVQNSTVSSNPISNLADFITNQIAASNIRPISPLAFEGNQRFAETRNTSSPETFLQKQQVCFSNSNNFTDKLNNLISAQNNIDTTGAGMVVSIDTTDNGSFPLTRNNCNNEIVMDIQDALGLGLDSPYSLMSETDPPNVSEFIEVLSEPSGMSTGPAVSSSSLPNFGAIDSSNNMSYSCMNANNSSKVKELNSNNVVTSFCNANNFNPPLTSTVTSVNLTPNSINENHLGLNVPVNVSEIERSTVLVQTPTQSLNGQALDSSLGLTTMVGQGHDGNRPQQYFIVQTTGANGYPANIAVPASILISPQVMMDQKGQSHSQQTLGIRSSSAPPVQHNHTSVGSILVNSNGQPAPGTIPISFSTPTSLSLSASSMSSSRMGQIHHIRGQLGEHIKMNTSKPSQLPLDLQDVRVVCTSPRNGPTGIQHQQVHQGQFATTQHSKANSMQTGQYCLTTGLIPVSHASQNFVSGHQVQLLSGGSPAYSITPVNSTNIQNQSSNIVEVQVSRAASQPPTIGQVVTVGRRQGGNNGEMWNTIYGQNPRSQIVNVNLNGSNGSPRIITTTQPGQHPVISIPDTTQNGVCVTGANGQDFDIFSAIAKVTEGVTIKLDQGGNEHNNRGVLISSAAPESVSRSPAVERQEFHRLVEDGQISMESAANCVCDLRAMIMCRKCGAYCHDDCIGPTDLCMTCIV